MPNKNYISGRSFEYERMKRWRAEGYEVVRSSGSHGLWDLCAVKFNRPVELLQCKLVNNLSTMKRLIKRFKAYPAIIPHPHYHQTLEVRVKGSKEIYSATV